jgi:hypothetical protein
MKELHCAPSTGIGVEFFLSLVSQGARKSTLVFSSTWIGFVALLVSKIQVYPCVTLSDPK